MVDTDDTRRTIHDGRRTTPGVWHKLPTGELKIQTGFIKLVKEVLESWSCAIMSCKNLVSLQSLHVLAKLKTIKIRDEGDFLAIQSSESETLLSCTDMVLIFYNCISWVLINIFNSKLVWIKL